MNYYRILLVVVAAILTSCKALASPLEPKTKVSPTSSDVASFGPSTIAASGVRRVLRGRTTDDTRENESLAVNIDAVDTDNAEERGLLSSLKANYLTRVSVYADDTNVYVKNKLGMEGLTGAALKAHPNYKYLQLFRYKKKGQQLKDWVKKEVPTSKVWTIMGLNRYSAAQAKNAPEFKTYLRYMKMFDEKMWRRRFFPKHQPKIVIGGHPGEMSAKVEIWAAAGRPNSYVKKMLGLDGLSNIALKTSPDYKYYLEFLKLAKRTE